MRIQFGVKRWNAVAARALVAIVLMASAISCGGGLTEPTAEEQALARARIIHVDRPAAGNYLFAGQTEQLTVQAFDSAGAVIQTALPFSWDSRDSTIIAVDQSGQIRAKRPGYAWIYARLSTGVSGFYALTVSDPSGVYLVNPDSSRMLPGQQRALVLAERVRPRSLIPRGWSSSNGAVATVDSIGAVTAVAPGVATVSVSYLGATFRSEIYVAAIATPLRFSQVGTGVQSSCGLSTDGAAYCWGSPVGGMLGSTERIDRCFSYSTFYGRGGETYHLDVFACAMEPVRVQAPVGFASLDVVSGVTTSTACGTSLDGQTFCWGATGDLTGGSGGPAVVPVSAQLRFSSFSYPCGVTLTNDAWCWGNPALRGASALPSTAPTQVTGAGMWRIVTGGSAGTNHRCGLTTGNEVYCWGANGRGQLGTGDTVSSVIPVPVKSAERFTAVAINTNESCALSAGAIMYCWGEGRTTPAPVSTTIQFSALAIADGKVCGVGADGIAYCRGSNGTMSAIASGLLVRSLSVTLSHSCAIGRDNLAYCWGANSSGQLGSGDLLLYHATPTRVVGQ